MRGSAEKVLAVGFILAVAIWFYYTGCSVYS